MVFPECLESSILEKQVEEKDEIIAKQSVIILEQVMTIKELYNKSTNNDFKKI
jgi:hypothetical protein